MKRLYNILIGLLLLTSLQGQILIHSNYTPPSPGTPGYPQIKGYLLEQDNIADATSHVISMPAETGVGDLILVFFSTDGAPTITINTGVSGNNWTIESNAVNGTAVAGAVVWKIAEGGDVLTLTTSASEKSMAIVYAISDFYTSNPLTVTNANGSSTNYDVPSNTGEYGAVNYLWFAVSSSDAYNSIPSGFPADFSDSHVASVNALGTSSVCASAMRLYNYSSAYDPGTFTADSNEWVCFNVIVNPEL